MTSIDTKVFFQYWECNQKPHRTKNRRRVKFIEEIKIIKMMMMRMMVDMEYWIIIMAAKDCAKTHKVILKRLHGLMMSHTIAWTQICLIMILLLVATVIMKTKVEAKAKAKVRARELQRVRETVKPNQTLGRRMNYSSESVGGTEKKSPHFEVSYPNLQNIYPFINLRSKEKWIAQSNLLKKEKDWQFGRELEELLQWKLYLNLLMTTLKLISMNPFSIHYLHHLTIMWI
ncbi:hypothetical protein LELG_00021 [Lodderomyces elongisporus NRRL YB-4239]|uniref:Transmembrane protein n=1 Tax=Lodderomyces elongisporus (strain ATCC 11503 / CBS 2605 / JCM 1781 / NBRC 1676 / NRRL YB-4239) TaxID=379508 RepID=A5DRN5_LODEL|nr:hypothetical protein LELG_00021 [Lodderomyces elongisporus NRRL YB-4239]